MVSRWLWWAPLAVLILTAAVIGLRWGGIAATITETDVITRYANRYLDTHGAGATLSDCVARPGDNLPGVWIVVSCQPKGTAGSYDYFINRLGGFEYGSRPEPASIEAPRT